MALRGSAVRVRLAPPNFEIIIFRNCDLYEKVNDQLKHLCQIGHSRHRSVINFMVNLVAGLIAYTYHPEKPSVLWEPALL
jgi:Transposase DDE domain